MIILNKKEIDKIFTMEEAIEACMEAYAISSKKLCNSPVRTKLELKKEDGMMLFMPGLIEEKGYGGIKIVSVFPNNKEKNIETIQGSMILINIETGVPMAILDGAYLTKIRTGAATGVGIKLLSREDSKIGVLFGTGGQAEKQLEAMITARNLDEVRVVGRDFEKTRAFCARVKKELKTDVTILAYEDGANAIEDADIIVTATTANKALFDGRCLKEGAHISGVGSFTPNMIEIDEHSIIKAGKIYIDQYEAIMEEAGDFLQLMDKGLIDKNIFTGEIGEVVLGKKPRRDNEKEITIFKSVGISAQDIVTASKILEKARELKGGIKVEF
ncbi:MAG: ornithine cyclodeaminase family protein [Filifactoraceae bacterium]